MSFLINPNRFSSPIVLGPGFSAQKVTGSGTAGSTITTYSTVNWNPGSEFNSSTGVWTPAQTGVAWITGMAFGDSTTPANTNFYNKLQQAGSDIPAAFSRSYHLTDAHGDSGLFSLAKSVTASETYSLYQQGDTAQHVYFSAFYINSPTCAFCGSDATSRTSAASTATITGYTERLDVGGDFDPTTGIFTAPSSGYYLIGFHGFPAGTTSIAQYGADLYIGASKNFGVYHISGSTARGISLGHVVLLALSSGDQVSYKNAGWNLESVSFSGIKVRPNVAVQARKVGPTGTSGSVITGWTEYIDLNSNFDPTTGVFTVPSNGQYYISCLGHESPYVSGNDFLRVRVNSTNTLLARHYTQTNTHAAPHGLGYILDLTAGDTIDLYQDSATLRDCFLSILRIE